ncbi:MULTISPECIES: bifunctional diaminohydroxyphosphoribosylaminopyrimidine deaminase/5-amino-6-(5-phosphoribosylamino)uracil reductase RibD [unclassified Thermosipho (in: thermotogales)]|uniref:bifunctional diaminohydroxyphosphoribosylaminopyrimidine deaminase/5-amino-6-(5-phosphoribosylamino)uracil reductase RibD n=1 Tax=unclassified Thermosipho (in: thermotogales) TaxID=2676525 RepID=UPI0018CC59BD|nr:MULTISPECIES: bifunctional diaminohydroxyphosphoribosylaminopyrimidine deaminase/5-amino-6-(5-phosphoribosylamino)uracil reductase RibD [unclassified Thermosipho (in: thermotogales)]
MEEYMKLAIELAKKGIGKVSPNPLVGAVIVKNGRIISTGYHEKYGGFHAERNAILNAKEDLRNSELYVNLEPCSHHGKTPPCTDLIISSGISKVYISTLDPNPLINGRGVKKLKENGIEVHIGLLEDEARYLNRVFFKYITKKVPYVALKVAMTLDGFITDSLGNSKWITKENFEISHSLRNFFSSIMVGANTVLKDNPRLTCRNGGRDPVRVVLDKNGITFGKDLNVYDKGARTVVFSKNCINKVECYPETDPESILKRLYSLEIDSVLIEGGADVLSQFFDYTDEMHLFYSTKFFGNGLSPFKGVKKFVNEGSTFNIRRVLKLNNEIYLEVVRNV